MLIESLVEDLENNYDTKTLEELAESFYLILKECFYRKTKDHNVFKKSIVYPGHKNYIEIFCIGMENNGQAIGCGLDLPKREWKEDNEPIKLAFMIRDKINDSV